MFSGPSSSASLHLCPAHFPLHWLPFQPPSTLRRFQEGSYRQPRLLSLPGAVGSHLLWLLPTKTPLSTGLGGTLISLVHRQEAQFWKENGRPSYLLEIDQKDTRDRQYRLWASLQTWESKRNKRQPASEHPRAPGHRWEHLQTRTPYRTTAEEHTARSPDDYWLYRAPGVRHPPGLALNSPLGRAPGTCWNVPPPS